MVNPFKSKRYLDNLFPPNTGARLIKFNNRPEGTQQIPEKHGTLLQQPQPKQRDPNKSQKREDHQCDPDKTLSVPAHKDQEQQLRKK